MLVPSSWNWFEKSVLGPSADCYVGYLRRHGYCAGTVQAHVSSVGHFSYWLTNRRIQLSRVDEALVQQFVTKHLPNCDCPGRWQRCVIETRAALQHLLTVLRTQERIPAAPPQRSLSIQSELNRYHSFLTETGGLAPNTCISRLAWVSKFLVDRFGRAQIQFSKIDPQDIVDFMTCPNDNYKPGTMGLLACSLRSYFRFRTLAFRKLVSFPRRRVIEQSARRVDFVRKLIPLPAKSHSKYSSKGRGGVSVCI
jgi:integrase/recombinase XerD